VVPGIVMFHMLKISIGIVDDAHFASPFLPQYVRKILRTFFLDNGIKEMKILLLITEDKNFDLCFSLESAGSPPENEHMDFLEAVSWFLPAHYSLRLVSEEGLPKFQVL
ncbi:MAG: hypothetical protein ABL927_07315, partial [Bdellovibrionales bacterium]